MLYIILIIVALVVWTFIQYETVSPKLVVKEASTVVGLAVGYTPQATKTVIKAVKTANAVAELDIREAGSEGPVGFREGKIKGYKSAKDTFAPINKDLDESYRNAIAALEALKTAGGK